MRYIKSKNYFEFCHINKRVWNSPEKRYWASSTKLAVFILWTQGVSVLIKRKLISAPSID